MNQHRRQQKRENTFLEQSIFALHMLTLGKLGYMFQKMSTIFCDPCRAGALFGRTCSPRSQRTNLRNASKKLRPGTAAKSPARTDGYWLISFLVI